MLRLKNMDGFLTLNGTSIPFVYNQEAQELSFADMDSSQAMDVLNMLSGEQTTAAPVKGKNWPPAPTLAASPKTTPPLSTAPAEVQAKVVEHEAEQAAGDAKPAKPARRKRRTKAQIAADKAAAGAPVTPEPDDPMVAAQDGEKADTGDPQQPTNGVGTTASPRDVVPEPDEPDSRHDGAESSSAIAVVDLSGDPVPDGWAKDDKGQLYCTTCGEIECSCDSDAAADAEFDSAIEQPAAKTAAPVKLEIVKASNQQPEAAAIDDPLFDKCAKETRLIPMMDILVANGIETVDAIYDKCMEWRNAAPALLKIKPDVLDSRLRRAISSVVP